MSPSLELDFVARRLIFAQSARMFRCSDCAHHEVFMYPLVMLWRGLRLRCPNCGRGRLFRGGYKMYEHCPVCGWRFEREEGYWTGAMAVNLVVTEFCITVAVIALAVARVPLVPMLAIGIPATIALPCLFYWHAKSLWMSIDFILHPVEPATPR